MKINFKLKTILATLVILGGLASIPLSFVKADPGVSLYVTPSSGNYNVGDLIPVLIKINTGGETINAAKVTLGFNENLEVQNISKAGSIFGLWIEDPSYDNSAKTISFGGAGAGTTYNGSAGKIILVTFKAKTSGAGTINFSSNLVKYGATTINVDSAIGGIYTINTPCNCGTWSAWQDGVCGGGSCSSNQRLQTRTRSCTPSGCETEYEYWCKDDSGCISQLPVMEIEEEKDEVKEEVIEQPTQEKPEESQEKETSIPKEIVFPDEKILQRGLLASLIMIWGEITRSPLLTIATVLCLVVLVRTGVKEWWVFRKKREK